LGSKRRIAADSILGDARHAGFDDRRGQQIFTVTHVELVGAIEHLRNPIGVRETATGKSLKLRVVHVILHAPDCRLGIISNRYARGDRRRKKD
jgi:hypothetical protein